MLLADRFDNAFSHNVVRKAAEGLRADDIVDAAVDELHHLSGQEPSLAGLVAAGYDRRRILGELGDLSRGIEVAALLKFLRCRAAQPFDGSDSGVSDQRGLLCKSQLFRFEVLIVEAVAHKVDQIRNYGLSPLLLEQLHKVIVRSGKELHKDLSDNADFRFLQILINRQIVKVANDRAADLVELRMAETLLCHKLPAVTLPFSVQAVRAALLQLIGAHTVDTLHQDISEHCGVRNAARQIRSDLKARIALKPAQIDRDDRDMGHIRFLQGTADKADVIGCAASAARL